MGKAGDADAATQEENGYQHDKPLPYEGTVSLTALVLTVAFSLIGAFTAGRMASPFLKQRMNAPKLLGGHYSKGDGGKVDGPISVYTFQDFVKKGKVCTDEEEGGTTTCLPHKQEETIESTSSSTESTTADAADYDSVSASGQHLVVDMEGLDGAFLNSDERLSQAIVETARQANLTLRSYHCHALAPMGVSCVGIFSKGHVAFHTWPEEGVITLDFYAWSQTEAFRNYLSNIQELFGIVEKKNEKPTVVWSHKRRGFQMDPEGPSDVVIFMEEPGMDLKQEIVSVQTPFQRIDIFDDIYRLSPVRLSDHKKSLVESDSFYAKHASTFQPEREVFLDGIVQSTRDGDAAYHEALVHPAMFAHDNPERVAIIGGGEGATLREVLKHATVKQAIMVEIDEMMINVSREYLPEWSSCENLVGSTESCFDEPRANVYTEDALAWFIDRFYTNGEQEANAKGLDNAEPIDVIILDALDPEDKVEFCGELYDNDMFLNALYNALSDDGVIVMQLGEAPESKNAADSATKHHLRASITEDLEDVGFEGVHVYEEGHCFFGAPWSYLVAFKDYESRVNWYANEAEIELEMHKRTMQTKSGESPFLYFDGATMVSYQNPHKNFQSVFCRDEPTPESCKSLAGFDPNKSNMPLSSFEVKKSEVGDQAGRGLFAKVDIPKDTYIAIEKGVESVYCPPSTFALLRDFQELDEADSIEVFDYYLHGYGFEGDSRGDSEIYVDSSPLTFVNHGCNGTHNIGGKLDYLNGFTEWTVDPGHFPKELSEDTEEGSFYDPVVARHIRMNDGAIIVSLRKIRAGEEILDNYLFMTSNEDDWEADIRDLRAQCKGEDVGYVTEYEGKGSD